MLRVITICAAILLLLPAAALANPTEVVYNDDDNCDPLFVPPNVDELGLPGVFPLDELIEATSTLTTLAACPSDSPATANTLVVMTNLSPIDWAEVWYVADPIDLQAGGVGTSISNYDGFVDEVSPVTAFGQAFKIDRVGLNTPLVLETMTPDGIFEAGETWEFIIDDYVNTGGIPAHSFDSIGVASVSLGGPPSSGSIIAVPVPEPGTFLLLFVGSALLALCRIKRGKTAKS